MSQSIETPAPQPPWRAGDLTHFSRGLNTFLTASTPWGGRIIKNKQVFDEPGQAYNNFSTPKGLEKPVTLTINVRC